MSHTMLEEELGDYTMEENEDLVIDESELDYEEVDDENVENNEEPVPLITDQGWSDYVLSKFAEDELIDGAPNLDGLRRITELLIGEIRENHVKVIQFPTPDNSGRATVECSIVILKYSDGNVMYVGDAADVYHGNTDAPYNKHPVATACSRAEARALRKALRLRKVISAEEKSVASELETTSEFTPASINSTQVHLINKVCKQHDINVIKFINMGEKKYDKITDVSFVAAQAMIEQLNKYNNEKPAAALLGYDPDWRANNG